MKTYVSIWDTGATNTSITPQVVEGCNLKEIGRTMVTSADGQITHAQTYLVDILLPNQVVVQKIEVAQLNFTGEDVLIGMDVIGLGDFAVSKKNGSTVFSFIVPSKETIDFVKLVNSKKN